MGHGCNQLGLLDEDPIWDKQTKAKESRRQGHSWAKQNPHEQPLKSTCKTWKASWIMDIGWTSLFSCLQRSFSFAALGSKIINPNRIHRQSKQTRRKQPHQAPNSSLVTLSLAIFLPIYKNRSICLNILNIY